VQLTRLVITGDDNHTFPASISEVDEGPGEDELSESGALTAINPNANVSFVPQAAGDLHYFVRTNDSSGYERVFTVSQDQVNTPVTIWGAAHFNFGSGSESQAAEISFDLEGSWLIARF